MMGSGSETESKASEMGLWFGYEALEPEEKGEGTEYEV